MTINKIAELSIKDLLSSDHYRIPIYQRNYAWGDIEVTQLIQDIADYASRTADNYYIGNLIVFPKQDDYSGYFETIDGQQRLTTLSIIICSLKNRDDFKNLFDWYEKINLSFDHREKSNYTLRSIFDYQRDPRATKGKELNTSIFSVYESVFLKVDKICNEKNISIEDFINYLINRVKIMRIPVPADTDLNHYFEIMNSRGEQLEKHEVLKARLLNYISDDPKACKLFNLIWESCSDMDCYIQMKLNTSDRAKVFSDNWDSFNIKNFEELYSLQDIIQSEGNNQKNIHQLFADDRNHVVFRDTDISDNKQSENERFHSLVDFPNFLLHVLKIQVGNIKEVPLDDKQLIDSFNAVMVNESKQDFVKLFAFNLLKARFLFDRYIIKREYLNNNEHWSLKRIKQQSNKAYYVGTFNESDNDIDSDDNKDIVMVQSMFHVSHPTQSYKYWLNAALRYVFINHDKGQIVINEYNNYLVSLSRAYLIDNYLVDKEKKTRFIDIIYNQHGLPKNKLRNIDWELLNRGTGVENFIFNFYDFLLWRDEKKKYQYFEFSYRTSVEHFYPQHPMEGHRKLADNELHNFGNLCIISRGMNSKFSNNMPGAKYNNFSTPSESKKLSLKLLGMMDIVSKGDWAETEIQRNYSDSIARIEKFLQKEVIR